MVTISDKHLGEEHPCYITFEAGPTHDGVKTAIELVKAAAEAKADAIKFQILDADKLISDRSVMFSYGVRLDRERARLKRRPNLFTIF